jgi:hypothetical protein
MSASDHDAVVRSSFEKQAAIFGGDRRFVVSAMKAA